MSNQTKTKKGNGMPKRFMARQGDILIAAVKEIPAGLKEIPREDGRIILAHGEVTGHAHVLDGEATFMATDLEEMTDRFLRIEREHASQVDAWRCERGDAVCWIPAYVDRDLVAALGLTVVGRESVTGEVLTHDEHLPFVVPPGDHKVMRAREYAPEAPVQVAD